jgi:hypothetical protein
MMREPLALTDIQLHAIERAATALPPAARNEFLMHVALHLSGRPSDVAVQIAINLAFDAAAAVRVAE